MPVAALWYAVKVVFQAAIFLVLSFQGISEEAPSTKNREPFSRDQFSGKTVTSMDMAEDLVIHRFYNAPSYGTKAPGFVLTDLDSGASVFLEELHAKKPVVIWFASYGCDVMRDSYPHVESVYSKFKDQFEFVMIYIREGHSLDGLYPELARVADPRTNLERRAAALLCRKEMKIPFRILIDSIDDRTATRWAAWPIRLFVVDTNGTVVYAGKPGPWGFHPGQGFEPSLAKELRKHEDRFNQVSLEEFLGTYLKLKN